MVSARFIYQNRQNATVISDGAFSERPTCIIYITLFFYSFLFHLILIKSYIEVFGNNIKNIIYPFLTKFSMFIILSLEVETNIRILERNPLIEFKEIVEYPKINFKYLNNVSVKVISEICQKLGEFGDSIILDHFKDIILDRKYLKNKIRIKNNKLTRK